MSTTWPSRSLLAFLVLAPGAAWAQHAVVTAEEVLSLRQARRPAAVVDARSPSEYRTGHIPGAINLPPERVVQDAARLPKDKRTPIIFYCRGPG